MCVCVCEQVHQQVQQPDDSQTYLEWDLNEL